MSTSESQFPKLPILSAAKDYNRWYLAIKAYAKMANLWRIYSGDVKLPKTEDGVEPNSDAVERWHILNDKAVGLILRTTSEDIQVQIESLHTTVEGVKIDATAHEVWQHLAGKYELKDGINAVIDFRNLTRLTLSDSEPMEE